MRKYKFLKVTTETLYVIPMENDKRTEINGWVIEDVVRDWFGKKFLNRSHMTRDTHEVGGSKRLLKTELIDMIDAKEYTEE